MAEALPAPETRATFGDLHRTYGALVGTEPAGQQFPFVLYKALFERGTLLLKLSLDRNGLIDGLSLEAYDDGTLQARSPTRMSLPFSGLWSVVWGGDSPEQNYHVADRAQRGAYDFVLRGPGGKRFHGTGTRNEDYYAYGLPVTAPCGGTVAMAVDGVPDNLPGQTNPSFAPGNCVLLETAAGEFLLLGHFVPRSLTVREGQRVQKGEVLGRCGNSGNSTEPHVHMHLQSQAAPGGASGIRIGWDTLWVDGVRVEVPEPVRGQTVENP